MEIQTTSEQCCYHHPNREAVVRCPVCHHLYCRECVTEHEDRMLCSRCLGQLTGVKSRRSISWLARMAIPAQGFFGFFVLWYIFYLIGKVLLSIPHDFHEGTIWQTDWWNK